MCLRLFTCSYNLTLKNLQFPVIGQLPGTPAAQPRLRKPSCQTLAPSPLPARSAGSAVQSASFQAFARSRSQPQLSAVERSKWTLSVTAAAAVAALGVGTPRGFVQGVFPGPGVEGKTEEERHRRFEGR